MYLQSQYREVACSDVYLKRESETLTLLLKLQKFRPKFSTIISLLQSQYSIFPNGKALTYSKQVKDDSN